MLRWRQLVMTLIDWKWVFKHVFSRGKRIFSSTISLHLERLREALAGCLGWWEASHSFLGLQSSSMVFSPLVGLMKERIYELEVLMRMGGIIRAWSICQEPWERVCIFYLVSISSLSLHFVKPRFSTMES